jgi:SAM-dependent methyltransferase
MSSKIKRIWELIKRGQIKTLFKKVGIFFRSRLYHLRAWLEDCRYGGRSVNTPIETKYAELGAHQSQSTDYRCLDKIFKSCPLGKDEILADIGCGEGRVLTYLYSRGHRGKLIGIELDEDVAETARKRTKKCKNVEVHCINVLEASEILREVSAVYLFNPFNRAVMTEFVGVIEKSCAERVDLYYCTDVYRDVIDGREGWSVLCRDVIRRPGVKPASFTVYRYLP